MGTFTSAVRIQSALVFFGLRHGALHSVEPFVPSKRDGHASSRWTLQAWASAPARSDKGTSEGGFLQARVAAIYEYFADRSSGWWDGLHDSGSSGGAAHTRAPHISGS